MPDPTAPISIATVTVNGSHWPAKWNWGGFDLSRAELRSGSIWADGDYHLGVPWMHPDDVARHGRDPEYECIYRLRLKRGWRSFVQIDGVWCVSKVPRQGGTYGTPPGGQIAFVMEVAR